MSAYLHIIWRWLIAGPLEGLSHITKYLHGRQQVTSVEVPPLGEVQQVFSYLGHPILCQRPLALGKVPLNLQKQEKTILGASVSVHAKLHIWSKCSAENQKERLHSLRPFMWHLYLSHAKIYSASQMYWNEPIWIKELTGAEDTHLGRNCTVKWQFISLHRDYVHKYTFTGVALYVLSQLFWIILFLTVMEGYQNYLF